MRLLTYVDPPTGRLFVGALARDGRRVVDLTAIGVEDMFVAAERAPRLARVAGHLVEPEGAASWTIDQLRVVAPMPGARGVHAAPPAARESVAGRALALVDDEPALRFADPAPLLGPGDELRARPGDRWAVGVGAVLAAGGRDIPADEALARVAGYAIAGRWLGDAATDQPTVQLGPWLVTPDDAGTAGRPRAARVVVDGTAVAEGAWEVGAPFARLIAAASRRYELRAGDLLTAFVIGPDGAACAASLAPGQSVRLEVEGLGALPATVV